MNDYWINPILKLYKDTSNIKREPAVVSSSTIKMISIINETTSKTQFKTAWKNNGNHKLKMRGPHESCGTGLGLHMAVSKNNLEITKFFIKHFKGKSIDSVINFTSPLMTPLMEAINMRKLLETKEEKKTNLKIIRKLLTANADVNLSVFFKFRFDGFNISPLSCALEAADLELTKLLLKNGAHKFYTLSPQRNALIKQKFTKEENKVYKRAKKKLKNKQIKHIVDKAILFTNGVSDQLDQSSALNYFPKDIVKQIFTSEIWNFSGRAESSNQKRVDEVKGWIEGSQQICFGKYGTSLIPND